MHAYTMYTQGKGSLFYFDESRREDGQTYVAIYTKIDGKEVYLQPSSNEDHPYTIIAADGPPKYIFTLEEEIKKDGRCVPWLLSTFFHYASEHHYKLLALGALGIAGLASIGYAATR